MLSTDVKLDMNGQRRSVRREGRRGGEEDVNFAAVTVYLWATMAWDHYASGGAFKEGSFTRMGCASIEIMLDTGSMINVPVDRNELWYVNMATMVFGILELPSREDFRLWWTILYTKKRNLISLRTKRLML